VVGLEGYGLHVVDTVPLQVDPNPLNLHYLETKQQKLGHILNLHSLDEPNKDDA